MLYCTLKILPAESESKAGGIGLSSSIIWRARVFFVQGDL